MSVGVYMDVHVQNAVTEGLSRRGVNVLRAQDDGAGELDDPVLLDRASALGRLLVTEDDDLLNEAARRQRSGEPFAGVVFASRRRVTVSQAIDDLELLAQAGDPAEFSGTVIYLPLR